MRRSTALTAAAALLLLLAASLAAAYMSIAAYVERSEEVETRRMFRDWMAKFNKTYGSIGEEEHRYAVYKKNRRRRNAAVKTSVDAARLLNGFGDLTEQELNSICRGCVPARPADWRKRRGRVAEVKRFPVKRSHRTEVEMEGITTPGEMKRAWI